MRKQIKLFASDSLIELEEEVNEFLLEVNAAMIDDIKYTSVATSVEEEALKLHSAMVIYQIKDEPTGYIKKNLRRGTHSSVDI